MAPAEVWFYHLERTPLDQALPELLEKTLARGWRALVRTGAPERLAALDQHLWAYKDESFLAHGRADAAAPEAQPVLLTTEAANLNGAAVVFLIEGAEPVPLDGYARCVLMFDGRDAEELAEARGRWSTFKSQGLACSYWRQGERGWERVQ